MVGADDRIKRDTKGKGKIHQGLGYQLARDEQRRYGGCCHWNWLNEAHCWFEQQYMRQQGTFERDPKQRDIRVWEQEKGDGPVQGKGKGKRSQGKGQSKGKHTVSDQETSGNERLDEMLRSLE